MKNFPVNFVTYFDKKKQCNAVKAITTYGGRYVSAIAYTHPNDTFNEELGKQIALTRLQAKIAKKKADGWARKAKQCSIEVAYANDYIKRMNKEADRALVNSSNFRVEQKDLEKKLDELLKSIV